MNWVQPYLGYAGSMNPDCELWEVYLQNNHPHHYKNWYPHVPPINEPDIYSFWVDMSVLGQNRVAEAGQVLRRVLFIPLHFSKAHKDGQEFFDFCAPKALEHKVAWWRSGSGEREDVCFSHAFHQDLRASSNSLRAP